VVCGGVGEYKIILKASVAAKIEAIEPHRERCTLRWKIAALIGDPRPPTVEVFPGYADRCRLRHGRYRIIYKVDDIRNEVTIVAVGHRRR
jgi:mRNA-degrading endonuclease RelE of RelBE toxin-antitoxin system